MAFQEMSDDFWLQAEPLLEPFKRKHAGGRPPIEFRVILNGILYLLRTGCQWDCLPRCDGAKSTVHEHFQQWAQAGVLNELFRVMASVYQEQSGLQWTWQSMDGALVQAPVHGQSVCLAEEGLGRNPTDRGRSGCKIHVQVDQQGVPMGVVVVGANVHDSRLVSSTLATTILPRPVPTPDDPQHLCLDKGYDYPRVEVEVKGHGYLPHIRRIGEEKLAEGAKTHPARRWVVERAIAWLKGFRAIRTRYVCQARNYLALIHLACAQIIFRKLKAT
jgi:putative transposase